MLSSFPASMHIHRVIDCNSQDLTDSAESMQQAVRMLEKARQFRYPNDRVQTSFAVLASWLFKLLLGLQGSWQVWTFTVSGGRAVGLLTEGEGMLLQIDW